MEILRNEIEHLEAWFADLKKDNDHSHEIIVAKMDHMSEVVSSLKTDIALVKYKVGVISAIIVIVASKATDIVSAFAGG